MLYYPNLTVEGIEKQINLKAYVAEARVEMVFSTP